VHTTLGETIQAIRKRLHMTRAQYASELWTSLSNVSRYERGQVKPGKRVLLHLLKLAEGDERQPILDSLGVANEADIKANIAGDLAVLRTQLLPGPPEAGSDPLRAAFAREAADIVSLDGAQMDAALVEILRRWRKNSGSRQMKIHLRRFLAYLDMALLEPKELAAERE
jgi:transcriptional regulator with XRE-family HTH domain